MENGSHEIHHRLKAARGVLSHPETIRNANQKII